MLERFYSNRELILKKSLELFKNSNSTTPKVGCELEFFLLCGDVAASDEEVSDFISQLQKFYIVEKERGQSQIEIKTAYKADLVALCLEIENCKKHITELAQEKNLKASFASQPFLGDCGSALQFNLSLHDENDHNLFLDNRNLTKETAQSLLSATNFMMIFLAPKQDDYIRFSKEINFELFKKGKFTAPVNLSFGADNRTCAIRIPQMREGKRLEYRIACADSDPFLSIAVILIALTQKTSQQFEQIFGNAFDEKYVLESFCQSLEQAQSFFSDEANFIRKKLESFL